MCMVLGVEMADGYFGIWDSRRYSWICTGRYGSPSRWYPICPGAWLAMQHRGDRKETHTDRQHNHNTTKKNTNTHTHTHPPTHSCTHTNMYKHTHTHTHTNTHTHTHTHTHTQ